MRATLSLCVLACALAACRDEPPPEVSTYALEVRDGVTYVTSDVPVWTTRNAWRVSGRPLQKIGEPGSSLPVELGEITALGWLPDGRVFVGDAQAHAVHLFSPEGAFLQTLGGEGAEGLRDVQAVLPYRGDSLFVYGQGAVDVFAPDLTPARRFTSPDLSYAISSALDDGRFLLTRKANRRADGGSGLVPDTSLILVTNAEGASLDTIGRFQVWVHTTAADGQWRPVFLAPIGGFVSRGGRILWTEGLTCEFVEADPSGEIARVMRCPREPDAVTERVQNDFKRRYLAQLSRTDEAAVEQMRQDLDSGTFYPALPVTSGEIKIDAQGYVWVGRYKFPGLYASEWDVFDGAGVWLGEVDTPEGLIVHEIGEDRVIGVAMESGGVQYVQVHRLTRQ